MWIDQGRVGETTLMYAYWLVCETTGFHMNYFQQLTLESWYTNLEQMLAPYKQLIHSIDETNKQT